MSASAVLDDVYLFHKIMLMNVHGELLTGKPYHKIRIRNVLKEVTDYIRKPVIRKAVIHWLDNITGNEGHGETIKYSLAEMNVRVMNDHRREWYEPNITYWLVETV